jgi:pSer/pThr/pTyr-binding forkhead associated (FHA) protein
MPSIKRLDDGETVVIRQWPFRIGRMAEQVDFYIKNPAIGRIHVELTKGSDGYCITDMNTRNGTYINGVRIEPNREQPINDGDRFMLANEEFQFFE